MINNKIANDINTAIEQGLNMEIVYEKNPVEKTKREISDIQYSEEYGTSYINAFCHIKNERRTFRIDKIVSALLLTQDNGKDLNETVSSPLIIGKDYRFNPHKPIFKLFGKEYN